MNQIKKQVVVGLGRVIQFHFVLIGLAFIAFSMDFLFILSTVSFEQLSLRLLNKRELLVIIMMFYLGTISLYLSNFSIFKVKRPQWTMN